MSVFNWLHSIFLKSRSEYSIITNGDKSVYFVRVIENINWYGPISYEWLCYGSTTVRRKFYSLDEARTAVYEHNSIEVVNSFCTDWVEEERIIFA